MQEFLKMAGGFAPIFQFLLFVIVAVVFLVLFKDDIAQRFFGRKKNGIDPTESRHDVVDARFDAIDARLLVLQENHAAHILDKLGDIEEKQGNFCKKMDKAIEHLEAIRVDGVRVRA